MGSLIAVVSSSLIITYHHRVDQPSAMRNAVWARLVPRRVANFNTSSCNRCRFSSVIGGNFTPNDDPSLQQTVAPERQTGGLPSSRSSVIVRVLPAATGALHSIRHPSLDRLRSRPSLVERPPVSSLA